MSSKVVIPDNFVEFTYSRAQRSLIGTWQAKWLSREEPSLGATMTIPDLMTGGLITSYVLEGRIAEDGDDSTPLRQYNIGGYDAGFRLMKTPPSIHQLTATDLGALIIQIANYAGLEADVTLSSNISLDPRDLAVGNTCAQVIMDLASYGGSNAYINKLGKLIVTPPVPLNTLLLTVSNKLSREGRDLDLDGYATGVLVVLGRRGKKDSSSSTGTSNNTDQSVLEGTLTTVTRSGITSIIGGTIAWSYTMILPLQIITEYKAEIYLPTSGIYKTIAAEYDYRIDSGLVTIDNQLQRVWKYALVEGACVETTSTAVTYYDSSTGTTGTENITQQATHMIKRTFDTDFTHVEQETTISKVRDPYAAVPADDNDFDVKNEKSWVWDDTHGYRSIVENNYSYEERDIGASDVLRTTAGEPQTFTINGLTRYITLPAYTTTARVKIVKTHTYEEIFDEEGNCVSSIDRTTDDNGVADMLSRGFFGDVKSASNTNAAAAIAWLRAIQQYGTMKVNQYSGTSSISTEVSTVAKVAKSTSDTSSGDSTSYSSRYVDSSANCDTCPFFLEGGKCGVTSEMATISDSTSETLAEIEADYYDLTHSGDGVETTDGSIAATYEAIASLSISSSSDDDTYGNSPNCIKYDEATNSTPDYENCSKYKKYSMLLGTSVGATIGTPGIGVAGDGDIWVEKELYIDDILTDDEVRSGAQQIAENILSLKRQSRGILETLVVPLNADILPNGSFLAVEHNFTARTSKVTYRPYIEDTQLEELQYLMMITSSSVAQSMFSKEAISKGRSGVGSVISIRTDCALCILGGRPVKCSSKVTIKVGSTVLIYLPPGSTSSGIIQAVLK